MLCVSLQELNHCLMIVCYDEYIKNKNKGIQKMKLKRISALFSTLLLVACGTTPTVTKESSATSSAKASGEFTLYTSQPEADINKLVSAFNETHPNVKVNIFRSGTEEVVSKVQAEKKTGSVIADALLVSDSFTFESLESQDILEAYKSKEVDQIPSEYVDSKNFYTGTKVIVTGIAYNSERVKESDVQSFSSLTKANLKDQVVLPSPLYSGAASLNLSIQLQQADLGWKFYEQLKENGVFVGKGNGTVRDALVNGEKNVGVLVDFMAMRAKEKGAPIEFVYPSEGALFVTEPIALVKGSKNSELAKLFIDFVLSQKGQTVASQLGYTPVRKGVAAPKGMKSVSEIKPMTFDQDKVIETRQKDKEQFADLFGKN